MAAPERYIDFDAALAEAEEQPVVVRYLGRDWTLYASLPAKPVLRLLQMEAEGEGEREPSLSETVACLSEMVPADVLEAWLDGGMSVDAMTQLLRAVIAAYKGGDDDPGEAARPGKTGQPSSATGGHSKRTSGASTKSTSRRR